MLNLGSFVGIQDYPAGSAIQGMMSNEDVAVLAKALETGSGIVAADATGGQALRVQSLENTLKIVAPQQKNLRLWPRLSKEPVQSTTVEFTRQDTAYGEGLGDGFIGEIAEASVSDETYIRKVALVKFIGAQGQVSLAQQLVNNIVNPILAQQVSAKTTAVLLKTEHALVYGDSALNPLSYDGFIAQILKAAWADPSGLGNPVNGIVIDWEGNPPDQAMIEDAAQRVQNRYGTLDYALMGTDVKSSLTKALFPGQYIPQPPNAEGRYGTPFRIYESSYGPVELEGSVFVRSFGCSQTAVGGSSAPAATDAVTVAVASDSSSKLDKGTYYYWVTMCRRGFSSTPLAVTGETTSVSQKITLTVADAKFAPGGTPNAEYISIYRSQINDITTATLIARVPRGYTYDGTSCRADGPNTVYVDVNQNRDNCGEMIGFTWDTNQVLTFKQLAPPMKLDLAIVGTYTPFMCLLYGTPVVYAPSKLVYVKNIGKLPRG